jgi:hypothetical protein
MNGFAKLFTSGMVAVVERKQTRSRLAASRILITKAQRKA